MTGRKTVFRLAAAAALLLAAGCTADNTTMDPPAPLGDFSLGYNIVVADNAEKVPPSRDATPEEWEEVLTRAIDLRLGRYEGEKLYHLGVSVDGYALAVPGIPVVAAPKSALIVSLNVWDDASETKLTEEPKRLTVLESFTGETVVGSGITKSREEQLENLAFNAAMAVERYLAENAAEWFGEDALPSAEEVTVEPLEDAAATVEEAADEAAN